MIVGDVYADEVDDNGHFYVEALSLRGGKVGNVTRLYIQEYIHGRHTNTAFYVYISEDNGKRPITHWCSVHEDRVFEN